MSPTQGSIPVDPMRAAEESLAVSPSLAMLQRQFHPPPEANSGVLLGLKCNCPICNTLTSEPVICAYCGVYGHAVCLGVQLYQNYTFCRPCFDQVVTQYESIRDQNQKYELTLQISGQLQNWKQRAREAIEASTSIGLAVGGATATAVGAAAAVAQGFVRGAQTALAERALPPTPQPDPQAGTAVSLRRSNSEGDLQLSTLEPVCRACEFGCHVAHTYTGKCKGIPRTAYFRPKGVRAIANVPSKIQLQLGIRPSFLVGISMSL